MSNLKISVPSMDVLVTQLLKMGLEEFVKRYSSYELMVGESDCVRFIEEKIEEYKRRVA